MAWRTEPLRVLLGALLLPACTGAPEEEPIEGTDVRPLPVEVHVPLDMDPSATEGVDPFETCAPRAFFGSREGTRPPDDARFLGHDLNTCFQLEDLAGLPGDHAFLVPVLERACGVSDLDAAATCGAVIATFVDTGTAETFVALDPGFLQPPMVWVDGEGLVPYPDSPLPGVWFYRLDGGDHQPLVAVQTPLDGWSSCGGHATHPACEDGQPRSFHHLWRGLDPAAWVLQTLHNPRGSHVDTGGGWGVVAPP